MSLCAAIRERKRERERREREGDKRSVRGQAHFKYPLLGLRGRVENERGRASPVTQKRKVRTKKRNFLVFAVKVRPWSRYLRNNMYKNRFFHVRF